MMGGMSQFDRFPNHGFPNQMQHPAFMGSVPPGSQPMNPNFSYPVITKNTHNSEKFNNIEKNFEKNAAFYNRSLRFNAPNPPVRNVNPNFGDPNQGIQNSHGIQNTHGIQSHTRIGLIKPYNTPL